MNRTVEAITNLLLYWSNFDKGIKILGIGKTAEGSFENARIFMRLSMFGQ